MCETQLVVWFSLLPKWSVAGSGCNDEMDQEHINQKALVMNGTELSHAQMLAEYRQLERHCREFCIRLNRDVAFNPRCVAIGRTSLQQGLLWLKQSFTENNDLFDHTPS